MTSGLEVLVGQTIRAVTGMEKGSERVTIETEVGAFVLFHESDCCESVQLEEVAGNPNDLIGLPVLSAYEESNQDNKPSKWAESWTWTFYTIANHKTTVVLRWLGESNGYYSESVSVRHTPHHREVQNG